MFLLLAVAVAVDVDVAGDVPRSALLEIVEESDDDGDIFDSDGGGVGSVEPGTGLVIVEESDGTSVVEETLRRRCHTNRARQAPITITTAAATTNRGMRRPGGCDD